MLPSLTSVGERESRRILFISHTAERTGAPKVLLAFLKWLKRNTTHQFTVLLQNSGPQLAEFAAVAPTINLGMNETPPGRLARRIARLSPLKFWKRARQIRQLFAENSYDLIYSNTIVNGNVLQLLADYHLPTITHVHELDYWIRRGGKQNLSQVTRCTSEYIAVSRAVKDNLIANCGIPAERIELVYEFIEEVPPLPTGEDRRRARELLGVPPDAFIVGGCGAEYWRKGRDLVVHLLQAIRQRQPARPIHFVWVGRPGSPEETYEMNFDLCKTGVDSLFHATGEVHNPDLYYPAFDLFALLSRDDPFPLVCLEAAAMGIPILCFEGAGGIPELVEQDSGFVVPYLDVDAMAEKAVAYANSPGSFSGYGPQARAKVQARHTVDSAAPALLAKIEAACAARTVNKAAAVREATHGLPSR